MLVIELLEGVLAGQEPNGPRMDSWHIEKALELLEQSESIDRSRLMRLEFGLIPALGYNGEHKAKTLYERLMSEPQIFAELITILYKPENRDRDEPITENSKAAAELAWRVLHACRRQPGTKADGTVDPQKFMSFVDNARRLCKEADRLTMCDQTLGQILAYAPIGADGIWPFDPARAVLDKPEHEEMRKGFAIGTFNKRGVHSRSLDEGGIQERGLADGFRRHAQALQNSHVLLADAIEAIARSYENDATHEDARARLQREGE